MGGGKFGVKGQPGSTAGGKLGRTGGGREGQWAGTSMEHNRTATTTEQNG